ncbi:LacI family DNA-binding transcriptional regulator [Bifidobacterium saguini]|nr:LacI family DNA-binding transcriptional regulator [Bifidobacterium saguini]QTB90514.1 LacI family DNA-binding transcriptional regulator [Bifidobacterium saguini]
MMPYNASEYQSDCIDRGLLEVSSSPWLFGETFAMEGVRMGRVTIADVAKLAGVSLGTVSNMLNHPDRVRSDTRATIQHAIATLGYVPNNSARVLAGGRNSALGLIVSGLDHGFSFQLERGAHDAAREAGRELLIASADNDDLLQNRYYDYFQGAHMAGVMMEPRAGTSWKAPIHHDMPTVLIDVYGDVTDACMVATDNQQVGNLAIRHALELGKRRVTVVTVHDDLVVLTMRLKGIQCALEQSGASVALNMLYVNDWRSTDDGRSAGLRIAAMPAEERPDFVIAMTDKLANGIIDGVLSAGLSVPQDVAVMGCDGNPEAWGSRVPMTTIAPFGYDVGRQATQMLEDEIVNADRHVHRSILIPVQLLERESTTGRR